MSRPKVADERTDRLEELVDLEIDLSASALSFDEQLEYLLDVYETRGNRIDRLGDVVDKLERDLEEERDRHLDDLDGRAVLGVVRSVSRGRPWGSRVS